MQTLFETRKPPTCARVSVAIITFNQVDFIAKALDSVLMQRTSFDYDIVIGDDCSKDGTDQVIGDYQKRFPAKVKPIFRTKNVGMNTNFKETLERCQGDYVALLEGDDYWSDPEKMERQVAFLDRHPGCALCHHRVAHVSWPGGEAIGSTRRPGIEGAPAARGFGCF